MPKASKAQSKVDVVEMLGKINTQQSIIETLYLSPDPLTVSEITRTILSTDNPDAFLMLSNRITNYLIRNQGQYPILFLRVGRKGKYKYSLTEDCRKLISNKREHELFDLLSSGYNVKKKRRAIKDMIVNGSKAEKVLTKPKRKYRKRANLSHEIEKVMASPEGQATLMQYMNQNLAGVTGIHLPKDVKKVTYHVVDKNNEEIIVTVERP